MDKWLADSHGDGTPTCPTCRKDWPQQELVRSHEFPELSSVGYSVYQEWLYYGQIYITVDHDGEERADPQIWTEAYIFGAHIEDNAFCDAVLRGGLELFIEDNVQPSEEIICYAFQNTTSDSPLRRFLVGLYVKISTDPSLEVDEGDKANASLPRAFLAAVTNETITLARAGTLKGDWNSEQTEADLCIENADHAGGCMIANDGDGED